MKENNDSYSIKGADIDTGRKYELLLNSQDVAGILDGDILVTSTDQLTDSVMKLAEDQLGPNQGSGYSYLLQEAKLNSASVTRDNINKFLDNLTKTPQDFDSFLNTFILKTGCISFLVTAFVHALSKEVQYKRTV